MNLDITHIGLHTTFGAYLAEYETAIQLLFKVIESGMETPDTLAIPVLALMRHSMELGYKYNLWELHQMMREKYNSATYSHHDLIRLHYCFHNYFMRLVEHYDLPNHIVENFNEYFRKTEIGMQKLKALDPLSFSFRYPFKKNNGTPNFDPSTIVDLLEIRNLYEDSMILLRHTPDMVGEYVDIHRQIELEIKYFERW